MKFYFDNNIVTTSDVELQNLTELTSEQIAFYELHKPNVSVEEVLNCELNPVPVPSLSELKQSKQSELDSFFANIFDGGYYDETTGWTLFCGESNVIDYSTLKNAIMGMSDNTVVKIGTMSGWQTSTKGVVYPLLTRYSAYMLPLTTDYMELKSDIENCDTKENLDLISW
ncbi:MAG: hypothetical protein WC967_15790 [Balneolaceae bacterium]